MLELEGELTEVYLLPGESHLACHPSIIRTILGSCVGVTFWCKRLGVGALCHSLLPKCPTTSSLPMTRAWGHRYVDFAIRDLAQKFDELGAARKEIQVKLFGGADVLVVSEVAASKPTVGRLNCESAVEIVRAEGFELTASSMGGTQGVSLKFNTSTGEVLLRRLPRVLFEDVMDN